MIARLSSPAAPFIVMLLCLGACRESPLTAPPADPAVTMVPVGQLSFSGHACAQPGGGDGIVREAPGGVTHTRGLVRHFDIVTGVRWLDGVLQSTGALNTIAEDVAQERATMLLSPTAVADGTWEIVTIFRTLPYTAGRVGRGAGRGTGSLQGLTLSWEWEAAVGIPEECSEPFAIKGIVRKAPQ